MKKFNINKNLTVEISFFGQNYNRKTGIIKEYSYPYLYTKQCIFYSIGIKNLIGIKITIIT